MKYLSLLKKHLGKVRWVGYIPLISGVLGFFGFSNVPLIKKLLIYAGIIILTLIIVIAKIIYELYQQINKYDELKTKHIALSKQYSKKNRSLMLYERSWEKMYILLVMATQNNDNERLSIFHRQYIDLDNSLTNSEGSTHDKTDTSN